ncbi:aegerolysin family protein [Streptomyces sp. NPDC053079]|uniref:aegerolysin family protein n=1 Tax=Streptomyces sp. NPDC053079 TaxID=3365697 RepID=UPI0037CF5B9A
MSGKTTRATATGRVRGQAGRAAVIAALLAVGAAAPAVASTAGEAGAERVNAARSVEVFMTNSTRCDLVLITARLDHGEWTRRPPAFIERGDTITWESESNGVLTGTEGEADFVTQGCRNPANNTKRLHLHWNNPYVGSNSYDTAGTDGAFRVTIVGGSGNHAGVQFTFIGS